MQYCPQGLPFSKQALSSSFEDGYLLPAKFVLIKWKRTLSFLIFLDHPRLFIHITINYDLLLASLRFQRELRTTGSNKPWMRLGWSFFWKSSKFKFRYCSKAGILNKMCEEWERKSERKPLCSSGSLSMPSPRLGISKNSPLYPNAVSICINGLRIPVKGKALTGNAV